MDNVSQFSSVIGDIYDAALDSTSWPEALHKIAGFVGGPAAALYAKDTIRKTGIAFHVSGIEPSFTQSYFEKYVNLDPFTTARFFFPVGQVISTKDVMPHEEFFKTVFSRNGRRRKAGSISSVWHSINRRRPMRNAASSGMSAAAQAPVKSASPVSL